MNVTLVTVTPKGNRKDFQIKEEFTTLGRQTDCHLRIPVGEVSRKHCEIVLKGNTIVVRDLNSSNGTFVNGEKVGEQEVKAGDVISLAHVMRLLVQIDGQPEKVDETMLRKGKPKKAKKSAPEEQTTKAEGDTGAGVEPGPSADEMATRPVTDIADDILGDSFFDLDEDEEEEENTQG